MNDMKCMENAKTVSRMLNDYGFSNKGFCKYMGYEHKTLQQSFTRLCVAWLEYCGSDEYLYDGRNEASHEVGKQFNEKMEDIYLPMV